MFRSFALFDTFGVFHTPASGTRGGETPAETYYVLVNGSRILAGTDLIQIGVP